MRPAGWIALKTLLAVASAQTTRYSSIPPVSSVIATSYPNPTPTLVPHNACASVNAALVAIAEINPSAAPVVPASLAYSCLTSVSVDRAGDIQLIDDLKAYIEWNSNTAYLKNPPEEYTEAPIDIIGELNKVQARLRNGGYRNEFDVQFTLSSIFTLGYDNHLVWNPDIMSVFSFTRDLALVSVSEDGDSLPKVFSFLDISLSNTNVSPISTINGRPAVQYLGAVSAQAQFHDADTRYNAMFPNQAVMSMGQISPGIFAFGNYDGDSTVITFENGTQTELPNQAFVMKDFTGVDSGLSFFQKFCSGPNLGSGEVPSGIESAPTETTVDARQVFTFEPPGTGYPYPVIKTDDKILQGYFLNGTSYDDIAIVAIPSFLPQGPAPDVQINFQVALRKFLARAITAGKKKLILDMRGNAGGATVLPFDTFAQLFPTEVPYGASKWRAHEAFKQIVSEVQEFLTNETNQANTVSYNSVRAEFSQFDYTIPLNEELENFASLEEYYGPHEFNGDEFTSLFRYNFSDPLSYTYEGFSVTGYLENSNPPPQPFDAENIVLLQDGYCSSSCAIFSELMKEQGKVQSIFIGGLPAARPAQAIGGTKGSRVLNFAQLHGYAYQAYYAGTDAEQAHYNGTALGRLVFANQALLRANYGLDGSPQATVNVLDAVRQGDPQELPLEFVYEAADCRIWYTPSMISDVVEVWKSVADTQWGNKQCVPGSTGHPSARPGRSGGMTRRPVEHEGAAMSVGSLGRWVTSGIAVVTVGVVMGAM